jgi:hypothetical protein
MRAILITAPVLGLLGLFVPLSPSLAQLSEPPQPEHQTYPLLMVQEIQIVWFGDGSHGGAVYARGLASPSESNAAQLVALSDGTPPDKMLDLGFVAPMVVNPTETMTPVEAVFLFNASAGLVVGARVRAARNVLETTGAEVHSQDPPPADVMNLVRRLALRAPDGTVSIEGLSASQIGEARIVKPDDPIPQSDLDPNRLTVFVGRDNRVLYVRWN